MSNQKKRIKIKIKKNVQVLIYLFYSYYNLHDNPTTYTETINLPKLVEMTGNLQLISFFY